MKLASMKLDKTQQKKERDIAYEPPPYPYGLCLDLNDESLDNLGMETLPEIGEVYTLTANVTVTAVRSNATDAGQSRNLSLQITDMALEEGEVTDNTEKKLYGG